MKVLVASPIHSSKAYCIEDWLDALCELRYPSKEVLLMDTSENDTWIDLKDRDVAYMRIEKPYQDGRRNLVESQRSIRKVFLENDFTHLFLVECDVFPPKDAIEWLLACNADVAAFPYAIFSGKDTMYVSHVNDPLFPGSARATTLAESCSMYGGLMEVTACGLGCTLIRREVLEQVDFRYTPFRQIYSDSVFYEDLHALGIKSYCLTTHICEHRRNDTIW